LLIALTRYVSIASIFGSIATTIMMFLLNKSLPYALVTLLATLLILYKHIPNMKRLLNGTEPKLGAQKHV
jgi:glycerol-3-phosphate acyltransferase PlsY